MVAYFNELFIILSLHLHAQKFCYLQRLEERPGRSDGGIWVYTPPPQKKKSVQVDFLWIK